MELLKHTVTHEFPAIHRPVHRTPGGIPYLRTPGFFMVSQPHFNVEGFRGFLEGFDESLNFMDYLDGDNWDMPDAEGLVKAGGQLCYMSFGPARSKNDGAEKYLDNLKEQKHGSVFQHPHFTGVFYGIDRAVSHELVRHAIGNGFSQVSQRYVDGKVLRFVMPPEIQGHAHLEEAFFSDVEHSAKRYEWWAAELLKLQAAGFEALSAEKKRDARKRVNQCARRVLPNETETAIMMTGNGRSWRHLMEQRANRHADMPIRICALTVHQALQHVGRHLFSDYAVATHTDGVAELSTKHIKI